MYVLKPICTRIDLTVANATRSMVRNVEEVALRTSGAWCSVIAVSTVAWRMKESEVLRNVVLHGSMDMVGLSVGVGDGVLEMLCDIDAVFVCDWVRERVDEGDGVTLTDVVTLREVLILKAIDAVATRETLIPVVAVLVACLEGENERDVLRASENEAAMVEL
jgi:hypothetical protein